jgi:hypothetical protein
MNCERYEALIHLYVDHRLDKKETEDLLSHMETCTHCRETYEEVNALKDLLGGMQMKELPEGFEEELHVKLVEASVEKETSWIDKIKETLFSGTKMKMAVSFGGVAIAAVLVIGSSGLLPSMNQLESANYEAAYEYADDAAQEYGMAEPALMMEAAEFTMETTQEAPLEVPALSKEAESRAGDVQITFDKSHTVDFNAENVKSNYTLEATTVDGGMGAVEKGQVEPVTTTATQENSFKGRLIIKTANLSLDIDDYDGSSAEIYRIVDEMGGYVSDTSSYYYIYDRYDDTKNKKSGYLTLRIPHQFFDQFVNQLNDFGEVTNFSSNANDITKDYRDTTAEVKNLEVREAKLREIMEKAEVIEDIIEVERELSRVRSEINRYQSVLADWEDLVTLSTVTVNMTEVEALKEYVQPVDKDMFTKAREGFIYTINRLVDAVEMFVIWLIASSPILVPVVLVGGFVSRKIYKRWKK